MTRDFYEEHPFAPYIRILGKGKKGSRSLTEQESYDAMHMIMQGHTTPEQLGAFLMLLRIKEETHEELAGFIRAVRDTTVLENASDDVDLDWSSYAGKRRHLPWFFLSALLLAQNGIRVFMHGAYGHTNDRLYTEELLPLFGLPKLPSLSEARTQLQQHNFAFVALANFCPRLNDMIQLRAIMGLRSPVHTLARMINPLNAKYCFQGIFHPAYRPVHQEAALLTGQHNLAVFKGEGGEAERNPDNDCLVQSVIDGKLEEEVWVAHFKKRHMKETPLMPEQLLNVWRGELDHEFGEAAVTATAAVALKLLGKVDTQEAAEALASKMWAARDKQAYPLSS